MVQVLAQGCDLRTVEVQLAVEESLGEPVSRSSVKNFLASGATDRKRQGQPRGRYRLID